MIMEIKEFIFSGFIKFEFDGSFRTIKLINENKSIDLVKKFRGVFDLFESEVSVSYFISDEKNTEDEMLEKWVGKLFGKITADYESSSYSYSESTYGTDYDSYLKIGGHDLFDEFSEKDGKYCILKISVKTEL